MKLALIAVVALSGCTFNMTLIPRGGGDIAHGTAHREGRSFEVVLKGDVYKGSLAAGQSFGFVQTFGARPTFGSAFMTSNQFSGVATNGRSAIRCDLAFSATSGNGFCVDSDNTGYDVLMNQ